jgi:hypothetical protein
MGISNEIQVPSLQRSLMTSNDSTRVPFFRDTNRPCSLRGLELAPPIPLVPDRAIMTHVSL